MLAIWSTYNESNHCIYRIEDNDYLQLVTHGTWVCHYSLGLFEIQQIPAVTMVLRAIYTNIHKY